VRQVLTVRGTARKHSLAGKFRMPATQNFRAQLSVNCSLLKVVTHPRQIRATISWIVNEFLIVHHRVYRVVQFVLAEKLIVIEKWNREAGRHYEARWPRVNHFAKVR